MRKRIITFAAAIAIIALATAPALAHGSHRRVSQTGYSVCSAESCTLTGLHTHNGKYYAAHYYGDGHNYHGYCTAEDCTIAGYHSHDGSYCFGHTVNDGHDYHGYCDLSGCTLTGYHSHNGSYHFGHSANDGHRYHNSGRGHH